MIFIAKTEHDLPAFPKAAGMIDERPPIKLARYGLEQLGLLKGPHSASATRAASRADGSWAVCQTHMVSG